jgi:di/tricarboxylate transporter
MHQQLVLTFVILGVAMALFLSNRLRPDLVALLVLSALGLTGILTSQEVFSGFSRSAVITILAIFILAEGLQRTGVTEQVGRLLLRLAGARERRLVIIVMVAGAFLSLFMNNIAAASILLPAVSGAARKSKVNLSRVLMPLAYATILGGMATLLTTSNIIVSSLLRDHGVAPFGLLDFAPVGVPLVLAGIAYMSLFGERLLPIESPASRLQAMQSTDGDLFGVYQLDRRLFRARVPAGSYLVGKPLVSSTLRERFGVSVVAIERNSRVEAALSPNQIIQDGDIIVLEGNLEDFQKRDVEPLLEILPARDWRERDFESRATVVIEAMLAPRSRLIGQTLRDVHFRDKYSMTVLAIWRAGEQLYTGLADVPLEFGDALLLQGQRGRLPLLRADSDLIVLSQAEEAESAVPTRGWLALAIMLATLTLAAIRSQQIGEIMLAGALAMALTGLLTMDDAYRAVEWRSIFLVAGMLPMGIAITKVGAADLLANQLLHLTGAAGPLALLAGFFVLTALLTQAMHGAAVAAVIAPVAINTAAQIGVDPRAMAMAVALATSMAFLTPLGHPVNVLVMGPGGYSFRDYLKIGFPLVLLLLALVLILLPRFWPLHH